MLLEKREVLKKKQENTLEQLKQSITIKDFVQAKEKAESLRETEYWSQVLELFEDSVPKICSDCGDRMKIFVKTRTLEIINFCPSCREKEIEVRIQKLKKEAKERIAFNIRNILRARNVPKIFLDAKIGDFPKEYQRFINYQGSLYFYGLRGRGKTHLAVAIMKELILSMEPNITDGLCYEVPEEKMPYFISVPDLLLNIRDSFSGKGFSENQIVNYYSKLPCLIMDDIGAEKSSEWSIATLYTIIDRRYRESMKTIFTSNMSLDQLTLKLDDRITSRIIGMCTKNFEIKGRDRRIE